jgi:predicted transcriptional regulator
MDQPRDSKFLLSLTTEIVSAFLMRQSMPASEINSTIRTVYESLANLGRLAPTAMRAQVPAVPVERSVTPDYIVCLEDGRKLKMLKRHLRAAYNLDPMQSRLRWGLKPDYPMVAPNYARKRSSLARQQGLGRDTGKRAR